jgi:hypothetical protein
VLAIGLFAMAAVCLVQAFCGIVLRQVGDAPPWLFDNVTMRSGGDAASAGVVWLGGATALVLIGGFFLWTRYCP